jgi:hypothetical protein
MLPGHDTEPDDCTEPHRFGGGFIFSGTKVSENGTM